MVAGYEVPSTGRRSESSTGGVFLARSREMPGLLGLDQSTGKAFYLKDDNLHLAEEGN